MLRENIICDILLGALKRMSMISFEEYLGMMKKNLSILSRTANGIVDVSASKIKGDLMTIKSGAEAKKRAFSNVKEALFEAYKYKDKEFSSPEEIKEFITNLARIVNEGIIKDGYLFRQGECNEKYPYVKVIDIDKVYNWFCLELFRKLKGENCDYIEIACFCEYIINGIGHFFSDGCSKVASVVSAYVLMRGGIPLPSYRTRDEYYQNLRKNVKRIGSDDLRVEPSLYSNFHKYYKGLFRENRG